MYIQRRKRNRANLPNVTSECEHGTRHATGLDWKPAESQKALPPSLQSVHGTTVLAVPGNISIAFQGSRSAQ